MEGVTNYSGLSRFYFRHLLEQLIEVGDLRRTGISILDFGCGKGELKRLLDGSKVIGYDLIPSLSDVKDWRSVDFDVFVANEVFYAFKGDDLEHLMSDLRDRNPRLQLVIGISRLGLLNHIGKFLLGRPNAHSAARLKPQMEMEILEKYCRVVRRKGVWTLADVYSLVFKDPPSAGTQA